MSVGSAKARLMTVRIALKEARAKVKREETNLKTAQNDLFRERNKESKERMNRTFLKRLSRMKK